MTQLAALRWLMQREATLAPSGRATTADVVTLLKRVPAALQNWTWEDQARTRRRGAKAVKWHIDNEYHVQNLLWVVLSPVFPDLEDEEWFRSKGHKHPRCDLRIPSLRLIIEVKFLRAGTQRALADVIEQVSADVGLYRSSDGPYHEIIAFIWDNSRSVDQHAKLKRGLLGLDGVRDAVIVSRPGDWHGNGT